MEKQESMREKCQSMPNIQTNFTNEVNLNPLSSLSMPQFKKRSDSEEMYNKPSPFNIRWIYGYNPKLDVINLTNNDSTIAFYGASNCGVLFNWSKNTMVLLQGHKHVITSTASSSDGRWLMTADSGPENVVIIWDGIKHFPQRTIFNPHVNVKLAKVALSSDAKYLLTLGYHDNANIYWWIWSYGSNLPYATLSVDIPRGNVVKMGFNPFNTEQFLLMTKRSIWIGIPAKIFVVERGLLKETDDYELKIREISSKINPENGKFTSYTFVESNSQVLVATSRGCIVIYGYTIEFHEHLKDMGELNYENLKFIKILKVEQKRINVIKSLDGFIATGNNIGEIHFYDHQIKLLYWVQGFTVDCVKGLSFNMSVRNFQQKLQSNTANTACACWEKEGKGIFKQRFVKEPPTEATTAGKAFHCRNFIICTLEGVGYVDFEREKLVTIIDSKMSRALSMSVHPDTPYMCVGYDNGVVELYNLIQHKMLVRLDLRERYKVVVPPKEDSIKGLEEITKRQLSVTCVKFSPSGLHLACGLNTGELIFLHPTTIHVLSLRPHINTSYAILQIAFSSDSVTIATADKGRTVCVYKYNCEVFLWEFVGKHRAHYNEITSLMFLPAKNKNGDYKLLSLGLDRMMVEYDIGDSSNECLQVLSVDRVDQTSVPLCGIPWPSSPDVDPETQHSDLPMILIATDQYKYKVVNYATSVTLSTMLGPRYETPVCKMQLIKCMKDDTSSPYLLYATNDVVGIQKMPLDGNPWKHVALLGHSVQIVDMCFREDNGTLLTIGAYDSCVYQWTANYGSVEKATKHGGSDLEPYYCLIENGRCGWLFREMRDLFYYIQILCQGTFSPAIRQVKDYVPIDSLPDLMRALGYFPSEYEVRNLIYEAKYNVYLREPCSEIGFEDFVKLYLNHRPAFGDNYKTLKHAFRYFATVNNNSMCIKREDFVAVLTENGERFSRELCSYLLSILSGQTFEDRDAMKEEDFSFLPEVITFSDLVNNLLGIQEIENFSEQYSAKGSFGSQQTVSSGSDD